YDFQYGNCSKPAAQREPNKIINFVQATTAPARLAGQLLLVHDTIDQAKDPRSAWTYNPGQRRVRLAPQVADDNPGTAADGLRTSAELSVVHAGSPRATISACSTAPPTATTGSSSGRRRCTCRTTPTSSRTRR